MKKHIKLILRTLISNNACVEAARTKEKKYNIIAVIFVLFALFFAAMPTCVTGFQQQGGNWLRGGTFGFDTAMRDFGERTDGQGENKITFDLAKDKNGNHQLIPTNWDTMSQYPGQEGSDPELYCFISYNGDPGEEDEHKLIEIFYCDESKYDFNLYVEEIVKNINPLKIRKDHKADDEKKKDAWLVTTGEGDKMKKVERTTSFIVFGSYHVQGALYQPGNTAVASSIYGDYQNTPIPVKTGKIDLIHEVLVKETDPEKILSNCQTFFDQVYINPRRANTWKQTGIILGVDAGVVLLMGLMVFLLTRGKNNPFRIYTFWDGQKIAYYACLTPGIISLFGFLMSNMAMMLFILGAGVRVMWLSMRTLRYQAPAK